MEPGACLPTRRLKKTACQSAGAQGAGDDTSREPPGKRSGVPRWTSGLNAARRTPPAEAGGAREDVNVKHVTLRTHCLKSVCRLAAGGIALSGAMIPCVAHREAEQFAPAGGAELSLEVFLVGFDRLD